MRPRATQAYSTYAEELDGSETQEIRAFPAFRTKGGEKARLGSQGPGTSFAKPPATTSSRGAYESIMRQLLSRPLSALDVVTTRRAVALVLVALVGVVGGAAAEVRDLEIPEDLDREFREWLELVSLLITDEELEFFLGLEENFRRHAFIEEFWRARDPDPHTPYNELKRRWMSRVRDALEQWGSLEDARARFYLLNGEPGRFVLGNGQVIDVCYSSRTELEIWFYGGSEQTAQTFVVIFYRPVFRKQWGYQVWMRDRALEADVRSRLPTDDPSLFCTSDVFNGALQMIGADPVYERFIHDLMALPKLDSDEWLAGFTARSTELPAGAPTFAVDLEFEFPGRNQQRTAVQGLLEVPVEAAATRTVAGVDSHRFLLVGEVIRDDRLFESFRYQFEMPPGSPGARLPLVFRRSLRPGTVEIRLKLEDLYGQRFAGARQVLEVPSPEGLASVRRAPDTAVFRLLDEANEAAARGQTTVRLVPPEEGAIQLGHVRFQTVISGEVDRVSFFLNEREVMTKRSPPFSLELNLGHVAASHRVAVVAFDAEGRERARDELLVNQGGQRFRVRLVEPRQDREYLDSLSAVVQVEVPDGRELDRVELFLGEERVATLFQEPFVQPILLRKPGLDYVRAVGFLRDGNQTEDVVFVNAPEYFEQVEVQLVELFASVYRRGRPVLDLPKSSFSVLEDGVEQAIRRFEYVRDLPISAALLLDTSASMATGLDTVTEAALSFVDQTIDSEDRLALMSFDARPRVDVKFSNDREEISVALDGLRAGGSTALYDSLIFALHYFDGVSGQKALLLLSDGVDEASRFSFDNALETARRAGVTVFVIGMKDLAEDRRSRETLRDLAKATGGRAFFIDDVAELSAIYDEIQEELRSQYLLVYQSASEKGETEFRRVEIKVDGGGEVRTVAGYYP